MPLLATINIERPAPGTAVITIDGPLDVYSAPDVRNTLIGLINEGRNRQAVDLTAVTFVDSTGLGVLVGAAKRAVAHGGRLALVVDLEKTGPGKALRITGVHKAIAYAASVEQALELTATPDPHPVLARPYAPSPREIAQRILQRQVRACWADLIDGDTIATELDALAGRGRIRGYGYDALTALRDAALAELADAAQQGRVTVTITGPSA